MKKYRIKLLLLIPIMLLLMGSTFSHGQDINGNEDLDVRHEEMQSLYVKASAITDQYPKVHYVYEYENGEVVGVNVTGIPNAYNEAMLENYLVKLEHLKSEIINQKDDSGVYLVTESEPKPKDGFQEFYSDLHQNLDYPDEAKDNGIEGTVFVRFIVDPEGQVKNLQISENIETPYGDVERELETEAINAVRETSGEWIPAKIGDVAVNQWVSIPVKFSLESHYSMMRY